MCPPKWMLSDRPLDSGGSTPRSDLGESILRASCHQCPVPDVKKNVAPAPREGGCSAPDRHADEQRLPRCRLVVAPTGRIDAHRPDVRAVEEIVHADRGLELTMATKRNP